MKILVIDDDAQIRRMVMKVLQADGHEVAVAENGMLGMAMLRNQTADVVVTDIFMPEQEGIETILELRRDHPAIKIIAMSGGGQFDNQKLLNMAQLLGADAAIGKPFRPRELVERVRALGAKAEGAVLPA